MKFCKDKKSGDRNIGIGGFLEEVVTTFLYYKDGPIFLYGGGGGVHTLCRARYIAFGVNLNFSIAR